MWVRVLALVVLLPVTWGMGYGPGESSSSGHLIQVIEDASQYSGCGCSFDRVEAKDNGPGNTIFISDQEGSARIKVDGKLVTLSALQDDTKCWPERVGGRCVLKYRYKDVRVVIKITATRVCSPTIEACEVVMFRGQLAGRVGESEEKVGIEGSCGC
jgi:hypothetical protein